MIKLLGLILILIIIFIVKLIYGIFTAAKNAIPFRSSVFPDTLSRKTLFMKTTFAVLGHIAKAKGTVTKDDINLAQNLMYQLNLDYETQNKAKEAFNFGKNPNFPLSVAIAELRKAQSGNFNLMLFFIRVQIEMALQDGSLHPKEEQILQVIAMQMGLNQYQFATLVESILASKRFQSFYENGADYSYQGQNSYSNSGYNSTQALEEAYKILGVKQGDDQRTVRKAYLKLLNENHPDKLAAKGLPEEMIAFAKEKTQQILQAYEIICTHNGWK